MPPATKRLLISDDQTDVLKALCLLFKGEGYATETVQSPDAVVDLLKSQEFDLLLMDLNYTRDTTSGKEGIELLQKVRQYDDLLPVVVMTAWGSIDLAVEAIQQGARDFIEKPWDNARLLSIVRNQIDLGQTLKKSKRLEAANQIQQRLKATSFIAESPSMQPILEIMERVSPSDAPILITGENGTGKGLVARTIHASSLRASMPFVSMNMGAVSEGLFESELFGHVKGAFTDAKQDRIGRIEMAEGGTLFLDEIATMPMTQQVKLLRLLESGEFERVGSSKTRKADVRFLAATNADLEREIEAGRFRRDLLYRLNTVEAHLPSLRERKEDVRLLSDFYLAQFTKRYRKDIRGFDTTALEILSDYDWPGNVRELGHVIERAVLMSASSEITARDLGISQGAATRGDLDSMGLEEVERYLIKRTLARFEGNARLSADALGLSRSAFYRRLEKYGL